MACVGNDFILPRVFRSNPLLSQSGVMKSRSHRDTKKIAEIKIHVLTEEGMFKVMKNRFRWVGTLLIIVGLVLRFTLPQISDLACVILTTGTFTLVLSFTNLTGEAILAEMRHKERHDDEWNQFIGKNRNT